MNRTLQTYFKKFVFRFQSDACACRKSHWLQPAQISTKTALRSVQRFETSPWYNDGINLFIKMCLCLTDEKLTKTQVYIHDVSQGNVVGIPTRLRVRQPGVQVPAQARSYCVLLNVHTGCEAQSEPCAGLNRPGSKVGHLLPSTAVVKNEWSYTSTATIRIQG
jgi:hypothetical protein